MSAIYNIVAGQNRERLAGLGGGIFAVVMTLLVLDLHVPSVEAVSSEQDLLGALGELSLRLLPYVMSFMTLGIFWVGQQTQLNQFERSDRNLTWIHLGFLLAVTLMPFSTGLLAEFPTYRTALVIYWLNILVLGIALYVSWWYAWRAGLVREDTPPDMKAATERRIIYAQGLYAFGALLCVFNTYVSIVFIILVQLNYVFAPKVGPLYRL